VHQRDQLRHLGHFHGARGIQTNGSADEGRQREGVGGRGAAAYLALIVASIFAISVAYVAMGTESTG